MKNYVSNAGRYQYRTLRYALKTIQMLHEEHLKSTYILTYRTKVKHFVGRHQTCRNFGTDKLQ